jgi:hypothetical protein
MQEQQSSKAPCEFKRKLIKQAKDRSTDLQVAGHSIFHFILKFNDPSLKISFGDINIKHNRNQIMVEFLGCFLLLLFFKKIPKIN